MIRIDAMWRAAEPVDMRAGADRLLARVVQVFGGTQAHHGYLWHCSTVLRNLGARRRCLWLLWHSRVWGWGQLVCLSTGATKPTGRASTGTGSAGSPSRR